MQWLGPARSQALFWLLAITGLLSLILNAAASTIKAPADRLWVVPVQSALLLIFLGGASIIVLSRLQPDERRRALIIVGPALFAVLLTILIPSFWLLFLPIGIGWIFIAYVSSQGRVRSEYRTAIKHLRKSEYDKAIDVMTGLIKNEPETADHRRFRAELFRLANKSARARNDYEKVITLMPDSAVGYNGIAEVYFQEGQYGEAYENAREAYAREPDEWVTSYNLGMIEDRLSPPEEYAGDAIAHLNRALKLSIPDSRHRLLVHLWLARGYARLNDSARADAEIAALKRERTGLSEWKVIFESDQAELLRAVLQGDVSLADRLIDGIATTADLVESDTELSTP